MFWLGTLGQASTNRVPWNPEPKIISPPFKSQHYVFSHNDSKINTGNWYQKNEVVAVAKPDHAVLKPLKLVCGSNREEFNKNGLEKPWNALRLTELNHIEDRHLSSWGQAHEVSNGTEDSTRTQTRGHSGKDYVYLFFHVPLYGTSFPFMEGWV